MTTNRVETDTYFQFNHTSFNERINKVIEVVVPQFHQLIRRHVIFHLLFLLLGSTEIFLFLYYFNFIAESSMIAISLGAMFLTLFSYFILKLYYNTHKSEELEQIRQRYIRGCKELMEYTNGIPEHHIALANACAKLANKLERKENIHYIPPKWLSFIGPMMQRFSWWCHWKDYHRMRELLLTTAVEEHLELVKIEPTNLEVHASLANAYVMLSGLYVDPRKNQGFEGDRWISEETLNEIQTKFRQTAERAIEEFKILSSYAPDDPWVHTQLAYSYHDLQMPEEESYQYEIIHRINPHDIDALYKLGILYFEQGLNAQGLTVYEKLSQLNRQKAESLIHFYQGLCPWTPPKGQRPFGNPYRTQFAKSQA